MIAPGIVIPGARMPPLLSRDDWTLHKGFLLRGAMGDEKFFSALRKYFDENKFSIASPETLIASFASLYDVEGMIAGFVEGKTVI